MILMDTHIWIWWANQAGELTSEEAELLNAMKKNGLGVCAISCWEVAMLNAKSRIKLSKPIEQWMDDALRSPGVFLIPLSPQICIDSMKLSDNFHGDPADRMIVATAINRNLALLMRDGKIRAYPNITLAR